MAFVPPSLESRINELRLEQTRLADRYADLSKDVNGLVPLSNQLVELRGTLQRVTDSIAELVEDKRERTKNDAARIVEDRASRRSQTRWFITLAITFLIGAGSIMAAVLSHA